VASSTPEALWRAEPVRALRPLAVSCHDLRRRVHGETLLDGLSIEVPVGVRLLIAARPHESASLLLRVLAGLARLDEGRIELAGLRDPSSAGWARRVAYVGPQPGIPTWMSPREALELAVGVLGLWQPEAEFRLRRVVELVRLESVLDEPIGRGDPALGERVAYAAALLGDPEVMLLDQPLSSVDLTERSRLLRLRGPRRTLLLASRHPHIDEGICDYVAFLRDGRVAVAAPITQLAASDLPLSVRGIELLAEVNPAGANGAGATDGR
jgi:ABC-2 type transport system ATP-binding protein